LEGVEEEEEEECPASNVALEDKEWILEEGQGMALMEADFSPSLA